jgi:phosphoglycolate phosphatase
VSAPNSDPGGPASLGPKIRLGVVFDLDGTLIDSRLDIAHAANHALVAHGFSRLSSDELASFVGDGARLLVARAARLDPEAAEVDALIQSYTDYYAAHPTDHTTLLPGAREALEALSHLPLALCTNKPRASTEPVLANLRLSHAFTVIVAGGDLPQNKPHPSLLLHVAERLQLSTAELVMVGDGPQDILCAKAVGARGVGVEGGILAHERLLASKPDVLLRSLHELPALIEHWLGTPRSNAQPVST